MNTAGFDHARFKMRQSQEWDSVAIAWHTWWPTIERGAQVLSDHLVTLAQVTPGAHVLDIATGIGEPALTAAKKIGPAGHVVAIDLSAQMLAIAKERSTALGLANVIFHEMDAEQLDLAESSFDAILCRWGLIHLPNLEQTLARLRKQLKPGGRLAAAVWATAPKVPLMSLPMAVLAQQHQTSLPGSGPGLFSLANNYMLEQIFVQAGYTAVHSESITLTVTFDSAEAYTACMYAVSPQLKALAKTQRTEHNQQIQQIITDAARQRYGTPDGKVTLPAESICIVAQR